jgi:hypothetical protein
MEEIVREVAKTLPASTSRSVQDEPSTYGKFRSTFRQDESCLISITMQSGKTIDLFTVPDCTEDAVVRLAALGRVDQLDFPLRASDGQEFHLFSIATARGGNAVATDDYWVAVLKPEKAWGDFVTSVENLHAAFKDEPSPQLILEEPATTTAAGERASISFSRIDRAVFARLPSNIVSTKTETLTGTLAGGFRATDWRPTLDVVGRKTIVIERRGPCKLPELGDDELEVEMTLTTDAWSDGRTETTCVSVRRP